MFFWKFWFVSPDKQPLIIGVDFNYVEDPSSDRLPPANHTHDCVGKMPSNKRKMCYELCDPAIDAGSYIYQRGQSYNKDTLLSKKGTFMFLQVGTGHKMALASQ